MKVGVIGCGAIARRAHLPSYRALGAEILVVSDLREDVAKSCARKFNVKKWFTNYHELLKEDIDLVSVCTPNSTHAPITIDAAKMGKHVLVEKPMANNLQDANKMLKACKDSGVGLSVMHNYRLFPCVLEAKKRIEDGRIGNIVSIHAIGRDFAPMSWTHSTWFYHKWGLLEDLGYHFVDLINFLCHSPLVDVKVIARDCTDNMNCLNHIQAIMLFENKICTDLDLSWVSGSYEMSLKILGTAGTLEVDIRNNNLQEIHGYTTPIEDLSNSLKKSLKVGKAVINKTYFKGPIFYNQLVIKKFMESIVNKTNLTASGEEGREVVAIMDLIKKSYDAETK